MAKANVIYLHVWSGDAAHALAIAALRYPGAAIRQVSHSRFRASTPAGRMRQLRSYRGRAIVFYFQSLAELKYGRALQCAHLLHRCSETALCDSTGVWRAWRTAAVWRTVPGIAFSLLRDLTTIAGWWLYLHLHSGDAPPVPFSTSVRGWEMAYLLPTPASIGASGGAISHIRGFLTALRQLGEGCRVFTGTPLAQDAYENEIVPLGDAAYFFWPAALLAYHRAFVAGVEHRLGAVLPAAFYQRHTRFSIAGALLSRRLRVPLILEYNGPEVWMANHWDPSPFGRLIALCEQAALRSAARIIVVSEPLKASLIERGFARERIRVNPNGVDADYFCPGSGRTAGRQALQVQAEEVLIGFAGSFSLWHGIEVLQQAITVLLRSTQPCRLRFVLMGEGLLHEPMRTALAAWQHTGEVIFTGSLPRDRVVEYLDACDIVVSPHIPMPDGSRFFGSPTKLFEYMAMGKAIIASRLEQLAEVLTHGENGWLVTPGDVEELAQAVLVLALDPARRDALGGRARQAAIERHSWRRNVELAIEEEHPLDDLAIRSTPRGELDWTRSRESPQTVSSLRENRRSLAFARDDKAEGGGFSG